MKKAARRPLMTALRAQPDAARSDAAVAAARHFAGSVVAATRSDAARAADGGAAPPGAFCWPPRPPGQAGRRPTVGLYLPLSYELDVLPMVAAAFAGGCRVFFPHIHTDPAAVASAGSRMVFVEATSPADIDVVFRPQPPYNIRGATPEALAAAVPFDQSGDDDAERQPPLRALVTAAAAAAGALDVVVVPGVAFDAASGARLGKGGGFYDEFFAPAAVARAAAGTLATSGPQLVGVGFDFQRWGAPLPGVADAAAPCGDGTVSPGTAVLVVGGGASPLPLDAWDVPVQWLLTPAAGLAPVAPPPPPLPA